MLTHLIYQLLKAGAPASPCSQDGNQAHGRFGALLQLALGRADSRLWACPSWPVEVEP